MSEANEINVEVDGESVTGKVVQEVPNNCDFCGAPLLFLNPIEQTRITSFGKVSMVVGYYCESCETTCMYR